MPILIKDNITVCEINGTYFPIGTNVKDLNDSKVYVKTPLGIMAFESLDTVEECLKLVLDAPIMTPYHGNSLNGDPEKVEFSLPERKNII